MFMVWMTGRKNGIVEVRKKNKRQLSNLCPCLNPRTIDEVIDVTTEINKCKMKMNRVDLSEICLLIHYFNKLDLLNIIKFSSFQENVPSKSPKINTIGICSPSHSALNFPSSQSPFSYF